MTPERNSVPSEPSIPAITPVAPATPAAQPAPPQPATLEALLSLRPPAAAEAAAAFTPTAFTPAAAASAAAPIAARLLCLHAGTPDSALFQAWVRRLVQDEAPLHLAPQARFQGDAAESMQSLQPQAVLIEFAPAGCDAAAALAARLQALFPQVPCLAVGHARQPQCVLAALRAGVQDFLDLDGPVPAAQQTLQTLLERTGASEAEADSPAAPMTAIVSARSGLGCSVLASHLAWYLQQRLCAAAPAREADAAALQALLVDLGTPGGDCALYLNTPGEFHFLEAVNHLRRFDRRMAQSALARHPSGLRLLALPSQAGQTGQPAPADIDALLQRLRQYFGHVVADLGSGTRPRLSLQVARQASEVWLLCDQSVASVVSATEWLRQAREQIPPGRLRLVVNRHDPQLELEAAQIASQLQLPLLACIPERRRPLMQALNQGRLLEPQQRREPYVQALEKLAAAALAGPQPSPAPAAPGSLSPLRQLLQRFGRS